MRSGTELRKMYADADEKTRHAIVKDLFGRYTPEAEQIMTAKIVPAQAAEPAPLKKKTELQKVKVPKAEPIAEATDPKDPTGQQAVYDQGMALPVASQYAGDGQFKVTIKNKPYIVTIAGWEINHNSPGILDSFYLTDVKTGKTEHIIGGWNDPVAVAIFNNLAENQKPALIEIYKEDMAFHDKHGWDERLPRLQGLPLSGYNAIPADRFIKAHQDMKRVTGQQDDIAESGGTGVVATKKQARDPRYSMSLTKDVRPGQINKSLQAFDLAEDLAWVKLRLGEGAVDELTRQHIKYITQDILAIKERIATEQLPAEYVDKLKQDIANLEAERSKLAFDTR
jgi:hypothetical protein